MGIPKRNRVKGQDARATGEKVGRPGVSQEAGDRQVVPETFYLLVCCSHVNYSYLCQLQFKLPLLGFVFSLLEIQCIVRILNKNLDFCFYLYLFCSYFMEQGTCHKIY